MGKEKRVVKKIVRLMCICAIFAAGVVLKDAWALEDKADDLLGPSFVWSDVPILLELAESEKVIKNPPSNPVSSYIARECREGMVALWVIEGLRRGQCRLIERMQTGGVPIVAPGAPFLRPLNPICWKEGVPLKDCETSAEIHQQVLKAYKRWWQMAGSPPSREKALFDPLDLMDIQWYGGSREGELEIYESISLDGIAARRVAKDREGRVLRTVYYTFTMGLTMGAAEGQLHTKKGPYTKDMLAVQKVLLHFYDDKGSEVYTEDHFPAYEYLKRSTPVEKAQNRDEIQKKFNRLID